MHIQPKDPHLQETLLNYSQESDPLKRKALEDDIWQKYGSENTAFVLDMSGFSLLTRKYGIVHYLSMIRRMQLTVEPIIVSHGGRIIKFEADNCFAVFPEPASAARTAITIQHAIAAANILTSEDMDIHVTIGIDYGKILILNEDDMYGDAVNRACKMGEDIGKADDILITKEAMDMIPEEARIEGKPIEVSIGGMNTPAYQIIYRTDAEEEQQ
ncbi:MAG: adenylate/guanylate cyclase domain-containing protein [Chloroflexi bacterium]|nr:adenylate/guanylate cyclase domain-containing protein [Chloroflexi bacterium CFX1]MCK6568433.1 adenylate/guanylate cyclase domain-containing protein [Anaerolineales bacterium]MCQ3953472.1 adenylate/guanylate cyclase domain-containing protein [Chloroflexota bacterium]MDL1919392.1 adenylate/guanylate cyclase domain-containing protein [Chloroflexi bacterium CFX5]NUQ58674.1 adenylate/guanylate cyclase domain-containing protein [Anaerolineales bacterium]